MAARTGGGVYKLLFGAVSALFIGILVFTWLAVKRANPVMLDERGHVVAAP